MIHLISWINWFWANQSCLYFQKNCLYFISQKKKTQWVQLLLLLHNMREDGTLYWCSVSFLNGKCSQDFPSCWFWWRFIHVYMHTNTHTHSHQQRQLCKDKEQANAQWLAHPAVVRERTRQSSNGEQHQGRCAEKFMTHRWHLHHVNTTDKMFLSVAGQERSSFMVDKEQNQWVGEPFKAGVGPDAWVQVRLADLCSQVTA